MKEWKLVVAGGLIGILGMGAGAWVFGSRPVEAQEQQQVFQVQYRECFAATQESVDVNDQSLVEAPAANRRIRIPNGWTVVSSGGTAGFATILFCRP